MAKRDYIKRHLLIIELLRKRPSTYNDILNHLINNQDQIGYQLEISKRTLQRDLNEIDSIWGIEISFNRSMQAYEIENEEHAEDETIQRTLESFDLISALKQNRKVGKSIFLEKRKSSGSEYFNGIIHAIDNNLIITFDHLSFSKEPSVRRCVPKAIKETQNRFYLIAYDLDIKDFRNFGLERVANLIVTPHRESSPKINIEKAYQHAFGIERNETVEKIILKFDIQQKEYVKSLPFHHSQRIIAEDENSFTLELFIHATHDFLLEIMRHGPICEVIKPVMLRQQVSERVQLLAKMYQIE
ncbi:WYL domain-containing protein [Myroides pelagicus]|uniref:helix-turn-helix transcriptional regulator n=1 Tax=Myroides pelagicus TaxID=270914 RepID=UPI002DBF6231|nr:WYL domain-containing protein [Myroides pelagicus]MEC4114914.1 WYL domain-containing protein [Myroides pelagicus]